MLPKLEVIEMTRALAAHAGARQEAVARNVANADTPGYRAADLPGFAAAYRGTGDTQMRATRAGHLGSGGQSVTLTARALTAEAAPNGNTVSLEQEMVRAAEVRQQHDMALSIYTSLSGVLRSSLGRR